MADRLECWTTHDGHTLCPECSCRFTGSQPVALLPPRVCTNCSNEITTLYPKDQEC